MKKKGALGSRKDDLFRSTDPKSPHIPGEETSSPSEEEFEEGKRVSIILYDEDIQFLDESLYKLKRKGYRSASKSKIIRFALTQIRDMDVEEYAIK